MDRPNRITNRNIGTQVVTGIFSGKPNRWPSQPYCVIATSTPYAAEMDSRFISAAFTATVTDRNMTSSSSMDSATTTPISQAAAARQVGEATLPAFGPVR